MGSQPAPDGDAWLSQPEAGRLVDRSDQTVGYWRLTGKLAEGEWYQDEGGYYFVLRSALERVAEAMNRRYHRPRGQAPPLNQGPTIAEATVDALDAIDLKELSKQLGAAMRDRDHLEAENVRLRGLTADLTAAIQRYLGQ